ncbi:MAG: hypothetical protein VR73_16045 [Gammaproteobacteria bacterium BRH_c0]|nr:MAG: hypothetical protein VR73_16045 [Gammaproteobacteria bacterium BRH_c0]
MLHIVDGWYVSGAKDSSGRGEKYKIHKIDENKWILMQSPLDKREHHQYSILSRNGDLFFSYPINFTEVKSSLGSDKFNAGWLIESYKASTSSLESLENVFRSIDLTVFDKYKVAFKIRDSSERINATESLRNYADHLANEEMSNLDNEISKKEEILLRQKEELKEREDKTSKFQEDVINIQEEINKLSKFTTLSNPLFNPEASPKHPPPLTQATIKEFYKNADCGPLSGPGHNPRANAWTEKYASYLWHSETASDLWLRAANHPTRPVWVCYDETLSSISGYHKLRDILVINPKYKIVVHAASFPSALRYWEHQKMGYSDPDFITQLTPSQKTHFSLMINADAEAVAVQSLWEMKASGLPEPWNHYSNETNCRPNRQSCYAPIATSFAAAVAQNPDNAFNGGGLRAAFREWYSDDALIHQYTKSKSANPLSPQHRLALPPRGKKVSHPLPGPNLSHVMNDLGQVSSLDVNYLIDGGGVLRILKAKNALEAIEPIPLRKP